jgi:hypothetical protein
VVFVSANDSLQGAAVALIVFASVVQTFRKLAPKASTRWQAALSAHFSRPGRSAMMRSVGSWLRPKQATGNCGDGCGTCGSCGTDKTEDAIEKAEPVTSTETQPVRFHPRNG